MQFDVLNKMRILTFGVILIVLKSAGAISHGDVVIGDILLTNTSVQGYFQPLVYFTDGIQPPQYGGICYDGITRTQPKVICNQLGYELDKFIAVSYQQNAYPVWLDDVYCDETKNFQHILSCSYKVSYGRQNISYPCSTSHYLAIKCDFSTPVAMKPFDGQILLCPPDNRNYTMSSSFGLIGMYLDKYKIWRGLNQKSKDKPLGLDEANALCQQLGYTTAVPGSALSSRAVASQFTFNNCYSDRSQFQIQREAWLATDSINCTRSQMCFTCCFEYPQNDNCDDCSFQNDIVIQCTFDTTNLKPSDQGASSPNACQFGEPTTSRCEKDVQENSTMNKAAIGMSIFEAVVIVALVIFITCISICPCVRRRLKCATISAEVTCCTTSGEREGLTNGQTEQQ